MKARTKDILARCIKDGTERGYVKAYEHTDVPSEEEITQSIEDYIWTEINMYFDFEGAPLSTLLQEIIDECQ